MTHGELLAKPDKSLVEHLLEVYELGDKICSILNLDGNTRSRILLACLLHDIGKATKSFQDYINNRGKFRYPHALASFPFILIAEDLLLGKPYYASAAVLSHHSPLSPWLYEGWNPPEILPQVLDVLKEIFSKVPEFKGLNIDTLYNTAIKLQNPSTILHSHNKKLIIELKKMPTKEYAITKAILHLSDWLSSAGITDPSILFLQNGKESILNFIQSKGFSLRKFQISVSKSSDKLYLRAPTGSGKTEALLLWANDAPRILYLLPTQATVNTMWNRLKRIYGEENVAISHGRANYIMLKKWIDKNPEEEPPLEYTLFASVFAKPVVIATIDQFLMAYMNGKHWEEKQVLSQHSAIIIDEIHSYEPYTLGLLKYILENESLPKVALASATLPDALLHLFKAEKRNLLEADDYLWQRQRYTLKIINDFIESCVEKAVQLAKKGMRVLIITNTVDKSQKLYDEIHSQWKDTILLHSRFIYKERVQKEKQIVKAKPGTILISTQIVEVSLDISYDILFTELAPLDALIQRMGRVNRRGEMPTAEILIFERLNEYSRKVYDQDDILDITLKILKTLPTKPTDRDLLKATNKLYNLISKGEHFQKGIKEGMENIAEIKKYLGNYTIDLGDEEFRKRFITRKGIFSIDVIPEKYLDTAYALVESGKKWQLVELTVPIRGSWLHIWKEQFYPDTNLGYLITQLEYDTEKGILRPEDNTTITTGWQI